MTNSPRWDDDQQPRQQSGQSGQQGGWNDDEHRSREDHRARSQWDSDRPGQPQQREWSSGSANRSASWGGSGQQGGSQSAGSYGAQQNRQEPYGRAGAGTAPGYAPAEPSHDWGTDGSQSRDSWRSPGSQSFAAGYGMSDGANYDDRFRQRGAGGASEPGFGRGYGPDYGRDGGSTSGRGDRGFLARAGDEIASWFGDEDAAQRREQDYRGHGPSDYTRSDDRIREDVNDRLTDDPRLDARQISVQVSDGEVTLSGTVNSREAKRRAEDTIDRISGVKHVQNNLRVTQGSGALGATDTARSTGSATLGSASTGQTATPTSGKDA